MYNSSSGKIMYTVTGERPSDAGDREDAYCRKRDQYDTSSFAVRQISAMGSPSDRTAVS